MSRKQLTVSEWQAIAEPKFGKDIKQWKFKCCICGDEQTLQDFIDAEVYEAEKKFYFSCIGRYVPNRGCDYTLGGLITLAHTEVFNEEGKAIPVFEFSEIETV